MQYVCHIAQHRELKLPLPSVGKSAQKALLSPAFAKLKGVPKVTTEAEAQTILQGVNAFAFFLRVQRGAPTGSSSSSPKALQIIPEQMFNPNEYYAWFYEGSQWTTYAGGILMVAIMLAGVMFPLWPPIMRLGVWYLSIAMLGLIGVFFGIAILRLIFYVITIVVASPGIWIFPQLFADVGFVRSCCRVINAASTDASNLQIDSFIPLWEWDLPKKKTKKRKSDKEKKEKSPAENHVNNGSAYIEEIDESKPQSRSPRIEEVEDDD